VYGDILTDREQYMLLLTPEKRKKLQDYFGVTEEQVLDMLATDEEKHQPFKRQRTDRTILKESNFSTVMDTTRSK
jgi:hypothetical protein